MLLPCPRCTLACLILMVVLLSSGYPSPCAKVPERTAADCDEDGVQRLFASAPGLNFRLGSGNPNTTPPFVIEGRTWAAPAIEGTLAFWHLPSHELNYAGGSRGWTSRLHIRPSGNAPQRYTWQTQRGYLMDPGDLKNQEFTVFLRVHGLKDPLRAQVTLKIRGGAHSSRAPERASCVMLTFSPACHGSIARFGKELTHPAYDYVVLHPAFPATLEENAWVGLKLASWNDPENATRVIHRLYLDPEPFDLATGRPGNHWRLFAEYVDREGASTGRYSKLVDWGGWQTTLRADGFDSIDFAWPSLREIRPPQ